jgi:hypothetical protein
VKKKGQTRKFNPLRSFPFGEKLRRRFFERWIEGLIEDYEGKM